MCFIQSGFHNNLSTTMGEQGASLQKYNQELVKSLEHIKYKLSEICCEIEKDEEVKEKLEAEMSLLRSKLESVNSSLQRKMVLKQRYEKSVQESESAYMKILESSEILLNKVRRESEILGGSPL